VSRFDSRFTVAVGATRTVKATVKWFNSEKGFGFVQPANGTAEAFLHASAVQRAGLRDILAGTEVTVELGDGQRGPVVQRIVQVLAEPPRAPRTERPGRDRGAPRGHGPAVDAKGTVKWFKSDKGFGFISTGDGEKDVFIHINVMRRCGLEDLAPDQPVRIKVAETERGREALSIELDN